MTIRLGLIVELVGVSVIILCLPVLLLVYLIVTFSLVVECAMNLCIAHRLLAVTMKLLGRLRRRTSYRVLMQLCVRF